MERMIVVVFNDESTAYEASRALNQLDVEGNITIHGESVITRNVDGTTTVKEADGDFPIRTLGGTAIGSLIGLLGGPVGAGVGAVVGGVAGSLGDVFVAGVDSDFLDEVLNTLTAGKYAVVADVSEEWVTPVDTRMEGLGGVVFRTTRKSFEEEQRARDAAELKAEIAEMKAEHAKATADRKAKLQAKIDALGVKLQQKLEQAKMRRAQIKSETDAKVQALQKKAAKAKGEIKATLDARAAQLKKQYEEAAAEIKSMVA